METVGKNVRNEKQYNREAEWFPFRKELVYLTTGQ